MVENKSPICELKDNLDMAISKFIIDTKLQELLPKELRSFLPNNFEAEEESTVSKMVKFRTKQSQVISVKKTAKAASTISKEDAINKAKQKASNTANDALDQEIRLLQRSIDLGSLDDIECGLDSSTLEESIEQIDENNYKITKDLILIDLDLIIKKDEVLLIPNGLNLTNKKHIKNYGKIVNYGNILNLNLISNYLEYNGGQFMSYKGSSYSGKVQDLIPKSVSSVSWPEGTSLFFITPNTNTVTISNNSNSYTISQNSSSSSTITLNYYAVPSGITGFYLTNIQTIGGGGGGGGGIINTAGGDLYATIANVGNGGCGGANIITPTLNYYNESNPLPISGGLTINFTTGSGGNGGTCQKSVPSWIYSSDPTNGAGSPGGNSSLSISTTTYTNFFSQQAGGGDGGYVLNILGQEGEQDTFNSSKNYIYSPLANPTSSSSQYYDTTTGDLITTPIIVNGFSGGYGGMSYNANPRYFELDNTNGQAPIGGLLGAGGGSGVAQGEYSNSASGQSGNPYSLNQSGGGGGGVTSNVGGLGYSYYTYPSTPSQPSPSFGGGGGGAGVLWTDSGSNSGQNGGNGYNSITITFVTIEQ